jgi:hypothetical protein
VLKASCVNNLHALCDALPSHLVDQPSHCAALCPGLQSLLTLPGDGLHNSSMNWAFEALSKQKYLLRRIEPPSSVCTPTVHSPLHGMRACMHQQLHAHALVCLQHMGAEITKGCDDLPPVCCP